VGYLDSLLASSTRYNIDLLACDSLLVYTRYNIDPMDTLSSIHHNEDTSIFHHKYNPHQSSSHPVPFIVAKNITIFVAEHPTN
jgi:hypothetical protein